MNTIDCALLKNCVLIRLKSQCWANSRKLAMPKKAVEAIMDEGDKGTVDGSPEFEEKRKGRLEELQKRVKGSKTLIEAKEYDALCSYLTSARNSIMNRYVVPSFLDDGVYAVKMEALPDLERDIEAARKEMAGNLIPDLLKVYPDKVLEARQLWNGAFKAAEYPGVKDEGNGSVSIDTKPLASRFNLKFAYWAINVPEGLPPEIREREEKKLRDAYAQAEAKIVEMLYTGFQELVNHLVDRLTPNADGTKKTFQYSTFQNMVEFIGTFQNKNVFNDVKLASLVAQAQDIISTVGTPGMKPEDMAKRVRDYDSVRNRTAEQFKGLKGEVDKMIGEMPIRSFDFSE